MESKLVKINLFSRYGLAFVFFYHGLVPKIIWYSSIERNLVMAHNINISAPVFSYIAGILEILLAVAITFYTRTLIPIYIAVIVLIVLLVDVGFVMPE
jgi:hypothetical protein